MTLHDHAQGIAHEQTVHARFIKKRRPEEIVGREHREFLASFFGGVKLGNGHRFSRRWRGRLEIVGHGVASLRRSDCTPKYPDPPAE